MNNLDLDRFPSYVAPPRRLFLYTLDQVCTMLQVDLDTLETMMWWQGRSTTRHHPRFIRTVNISAPDHEPMWRVSEQDFYAWCRHQKIAIRDSKGRL